MNKRGRLLELCRMKRTNKRTGKRELARKKKKNDLFM